MKKILVVTKEWLICDSELIKFKIVKDWILEEAPPEPEPAALEPEEDDSGKKKKKKKK